SRTAVGAWLAGRVGGHTGPPAPRHALAPAWSGRRGLPVRVQPTIALHRPGRPARARKQPAFSGGASALSVPRTRRPKMARLSAGHWFAFWRRWPRRAGGRSTVWRIGTTRRVSYR